MAVDFITDTPQASPTEGVEGQAPAAPYVPSTALDTGDIWSDTKRFLRASQNVDAEGGYINPETGQRVTGPEARLSVEQAKKEYPGVTGIAEPLPRTVVENMQAQQQADAKRADVDARYPAGLGAGLARMGVGAVTSLLDPVDDAAFMVPVVGEARYATWLARAGEAAGTAGRLGVTAAVGAARGAGGGAILGAGQYALDPNMTLGDVATETLQSALAGGLLHTATGFRSDVMGYRFAETPEGQAAFRDAQLHDSATRVAAAQMAADNPVDVRPVFDAAKTPEERLQDVLAAARGEPPSFRSGLESSTAMDLAQRATYTDDAVARAAGRPTQEDMLGDDLSREARATTPEQVTQGQLAEIDRAIAELRGSGYLTPEEEAELAQYEPKAKPSEDETKVATVQGEEQAAQAEGQPVRPVPMEGATEPGGGEPNVVGERIPTSFSTSKGSTYELHEDGTTTRTKAARDTPGHEGDEGVKERTAKTVYVDSPEDAARLSAAGLQNLGKRGARVAIKNGKASLLTWNEKSGKWGRAPSSKDIPVHAEPAVGRAPLELWKPTDDVKGHEAYSGMHAGNEITELRAQPREHFQPQEHEGGPAFEALRAGDDSDITGREHVENVRDEEFTAALNREYFRQENPGREPWAPKRPVMVARLRKLVEMIHEGKITDDQLRFEIEDLHAHAEARIADRYVRDVPERARGADYIRQKLLEAVRRGDIDGETSDFAEWFVHRNPDMLDDLGISIRRAPEGNDRAAGNYNPLNRVMTLFKGVAADGTAVHEMLHHLERMMPAEMQAAIRSEWAKGIAQGLKSEDPQVRAYFEAALKANTTGLPSDFEEAMRLLGNRSNYQFLNPSEFWAENTTRILSSQYAARTSIGARIAQWMREMIQHAKAVLGLRSDAPMLKALSNLLDRDSRTVGPNDSGRMLTQGAQFRDLSDDEFEAMAMARQRATIAMNIIKSKNLIDKVDEFKAQGLTLAEGMDTRVRGISDAYKNGHALEGTRDSTAQHQEVQKKRFVGRLVSNLDKIPGAMAAWRGGHMTDDWVRELFELSSEDGKPGITKSPLALKIAEAVHDAQEVSRLELNRSGAWVGKYDGYISKTLHDAYKIHTMGFPAWRDLVLGNIDQAKTFGDLTAPEREKFLGNMWDALSTGVHMRADHGDDVKAVAFPGRGDIARRASSGRVLHWKDADSWLAYQRQAGEPVIEKGVLTSLDRAGRDSALMERWGTNPNAMFETVLRKLREKYRSDHEAVASLDKHAARLKAEFAQLTGEASRPMNDLAGKIQGTVLAMQDMTKLGNVVLAHLSTQITKPFQLQYLGVGRWQAYTSVMRNLLQDDTPEGRQILENLYASATGQYQDMLGGYEAIDSVPGTVAKWRHMSMKLGLLPQALAREKAGTMWELSNFLGQNVGKSFDQLSRETARGLRIYGITPTEWDVLRNAPNHDRDAQGVMFLTPKAAMRANVDGLAADRLADATDEADADRIREEVRTNLSMKLASYYSDAADRSTVTPGIKEKAFFANHFGRAGPYVGQYKSWAMAAVRTMWGQAIYGTETKLEAAKYFAELMAGGVAIGYARIAITDALQGKVPATFKGDDPKHDMDLLGHAMMAGGAMGLMGDYLLDQYSRAGESSSDMAKDFAAKIAGPAFADIAQAAVLGKKFLSIPFADDSTEALQKADGEGMRFLTSHLPIVNTFYLRQLSHWLFIDRLNEMADPGYLQRHQDAIKERTGQDFYLPPTQYAGAPQ